MLLENRIQIVGHVLPVKCDTTEAQKPTDLLVKSMSDSQVLLVWTSQLGPGYRYRISISMDTVLIKQVNGPLGFGDIAAVVVNGLLPGIKYGFSVQHECEDSPATYSQSMNKSTTTLGFGKMLYMIPLKLSQAQLI